MSKCAISLDMTIRNKYLKRSKISEAKSRELLRYFPPDLSDKNIAILTNLNRNAVNRYLLILRKRIAGYCEQGSHFKEEIEVDESYFGAKRIKEKRGRGAGAKTPVFGILRRNGKVYPEIVPNCAKTTLQVILYMAQYL